ncbi:MAG TPA: hypothetical protein VE046_06375 [Steroidobacteraceae bacterium]|nr:hypothetical protein [Steroidobacteraceae bacterium]
MKNLARFLFPVLMACAIAGAATPQPATTGVDLARLDAILAGDQRSDANKARDVYRHPKETLAFFGARPDMTIVEIFPGDGWYTEILGPYVHGKGKLYAAHYPGDSDSQYAQAGLKRFRDKLAARPDLYGEITVTALAPNHLELAPPGSADLVVTFRNLHNWMGNGYALEAFQAMFKALKPGGTLGVEEHRGRADQPQDPKAQSGYVREDFAIALIESAGFKRVARSEINANPKDTKDYQNGVWTLPPVYRDGDKNREKYAAIGESDRFTLKFIKP